MQPTLTLTMLPTKACLFSRLYEIWFRFYLISVSIASSVNQSMNCALNTTQHYIVSETINRSFQTHWNCVRTRACTRRKKYSTYLINIPSGYNMKHTERKIRTHTSDQWLDLPVKGYGSLLQRKRRWELLSGGLIPLPENDHETLMCHT